MTTQTTPRLVSKELLIPHEKGRGVFPGFISYIDAHAPVLLHRYGRIDESDTYDDFVESISRDNGQTWSESVLRLRSQPAEGGRLRYAEHTAYFDADAGQLLTLASRSLYRDGQLPGRNRWQLELRTYEPATDRWHPPQTTDLGFAEGITISFSFPLRLSSGRLLIPAYKPRVDEHGQDVFLPGYRSRQGEALVLIGERDEPRGPWQWRPSSRVGIDATRSSRGLCEPTLAELRDGRIAMICRGDNGYFPDRPGYKWVCFSSDAGETWSQPEPLRGLDGSEHESSATGSALVRSIANGRLYWIGNLCADGERPNGGWPRSPLCIAEVCEAPFGLLPDTLTEIDRRQIGDSPKTQLSNFRYYQDRQTGEIVVLLTRFGEEDAQNFRRAGYYRYRIAVGP